MDDLQQRPARSGEPIGRDSGGGRKAHQHVHGTGGGEGAEQRAWVGAPRVAGLLGDVHRGLEPDEGVVRQNGAAQHGRGRALLRRAQLREPPYVAVAAQQQPCAEHDDDGQSAHLDDGGDDVGAGRLLDAARVDQGEQGQEHHGHEPHGQGHEGRQVVAAEAAGERGDRDDARGQHAEARDEAGEGSEGARRVVGGSARPRILRRQLGVGGRGEQRQQQCDDQGYPHRSAGVGRDLPDQDVHPGTEHVSQDEEVQQRGGQRTLERRPLRCPSLLPGLRQRSVSAVSRHTAPCPPYRGMHARPSPRSTRPVPGPTGSRTRSGS
ncbi:hypothetical protein SUDANB2_00163 [Streptomyces sp. enrichment culture]